MFCAFWALDIAPTLDVLVLFFINLHLIVRSVFLNENHNFIYFRKQSVVKCAYFALVQPNAHNKYALITILIFPEGQ